MVSLDDFQRYVMTSQDLLPIFADPKERVRMDSMTLPQPAAVAPPPPPMVHTPRPTTPGLQPNRNIFITSS